MTLTIPRPALVLAGVLTATLTAGPALAASPAATSLTLKAAKSSVAHNQKTTLTGTLKSGTRLLAGQSVVLEKRAAGAKSFTVVGTKTTGPKGTVSYTVIPGTKKGQKEQYELLYKGNAQYKASHSAVITITVT